MIRILDLLVARVPLACQVSQATALFTTHLSKYRSEPFFEGMYASWAVCYDYILVYEVWNGVDKI